MIFGPSRCTQPCQAWCQLIFTAFGPLADHAQLQNRSNNSPASRSVSPLPSEYARSGPFIVQSAGKRWPRFDGFSAKSRALILFLDEGMGVRGLLGGVGERRGMGEREKPFPQCPLDSMSVRWIPWMSADSCGHCWTARAIFFRKRSFSRRASALASSAMEDALTTAAICSGVHPEVTMASMISLLIKASPKLADTIPGLLPVQHAWRGLACASVQ